MKTLDIDECADFLKVDRSTALRLAGTGEMPGAKIGRAWVFLLDDLVEYLRAQVRFQARQRQCENEIEQCAVVAVKNNPPPTSVRRRSKRSVTDMSAYAHITLESPHFISKV